MSDSQNGSQTETTATQAADQGGCAGGCCHVTPEQTMRNEAMVLVRRADAFIKKDAVEAAVMMLSAAAVLISESGGAHDCEESVWLLTGQIQMYMKMDEPDAALHAARSANMEAMQLLGAAHPASILTMGNLGETLMDIGQREDGQELLREAIAKISATEPVGVWTREYLDGLVAEMQKAHDRPAPETAAANDAGGSFVCCGGEGPVADCSQGSHEGCGCGPRS